MTFEEVVDQALAMLQRRGRVTYRLLKRQFSLDDEALEDLKCELIEGQRLAADENGIVLVWTGHAAPIPEPTSTPIDPHPVIHDAVTLAAPSPTAPHPPDAERRQLTVMFCDLVDSTALSSRLDPEDLREVVRAYQTACEEVLQRYSGHIAQYLGDGLLIYFGYPQAHEDDAPRAVRAGLGILDALIALNARLEPRIGVRLAIRLGIHTGPVVVGEVGGVSRREQLALGETPNLAARIQGLATPDVLLISAATYRLVQGYFACQDLGTQTLRGVATPMHVYRVVQASAAQSRLDVMGATSLTPLVGRDAELTLLVERWAQSQDGLGQVILLSGEAGIGKSRLVEALRQRLGSEEMASIVLRCSPYYTHSALYPVIEHLQRLLHFHREETPEEKLDKLEHSLREYGFACDEVVPLFAALLSVPLPEGRYPPLPLSPQQQKRKTAEALVAWLVEAAERQPLLAVWEDLHWADPSTLELLSLIIDQSRTARMLTLLTCRPEFQPPWSPRAHLAHLTLNRFIQPQVELLIVQAMRGKPLPAEVVQQVVAKTDGVPLFVEELLKMVVEAGLVREEADHYVLNGPLPPLAIPATLQDSLMARLDRLAPVKEVAQLGAVLGRSFPYDVMRAVSPLDEEALQRGLAQLVEAELLYQRGHPPQAQYLFKHALIQDAAYQSLLKSTRQQYHQHIAQVLEAQFPETAETQPELLAQHYTEAGLIEQAIPYWQRAGQDAIARSANMEAISHLTTALALLRTLPETPARTQHELEVHLALGTPLVLTKGHAAPEVATTYARACELCQQLGDTPQLFAALLGLRRYYFTRGELPTARDLAEQLLGLAQRLDDRGLVVRAHHMLEEDLLFLGEFAQVCAHAEQGLALYDPAAHRTQVVLYGNDSGVGCRIFAAVALWMLGYPDQALQRSDEALAWAQELAHPFNLVFALTHAARLHLFRREPPRVLAWADAAVTLAREHSFAQFLAQASMLRGWALVEQGQGAAGLAQLRQGMTAWRATGAHPRLLDFALLAGMYGQMAQPAEGLRVLAEAQAVAETRREQLWAAELHRLRGALVLQSGGRAQHSGVSTSPLEETEVERCFCQALDIARRQEAKSLELRAAMSLARLWQQQGKRDEARELLAPVYGWFTEGFDTADLQETKALLEELGG
jgi:class 3 adenylate cyclase/predicted ATPase